MTVATVDKKVVEILPAEPMPEEESQFRIVTRRFLRHKLAVVSLALLIVLFVAALFAKQIAPYGATELGPGEEFAKPGSVSEVNGKTHLLGTDHLGRDFFSRILF